ncbi:MAG TPA: hypothetical protein PLZ57_02860 [Pseudobdellovibrionaceae bacterium]|nr:hypothetical protein [Pseudobdellovibrionaceae bacterium]
MKIISAPIPTILQAHLRTRMCAIALLLTLCPLDADATRNGGATVAPASPTRQAMMAEATAIAQRRATADRIDFCYRQTQAVMEGVPLNSGAYGELQTAHAAVLFLQCQVVQESGALLNKRRDPRLSTGQVIDRLASAMGQSEATHARLVDSFNTLFE